MLGRNSYIDDSVVKSWHRQDNPSVFLVLLIKYYLSIIKLFIILIAGEVEEILWNLDKRTPASGHLVMNLEKPKLCSLNLP